MRLPKWFVSISVLATIGIAVGWLWVGDEIASGVAADSPESTAVTTVAPIQDQIPPPANAPPGAGPVTDQTHGANATRAGWTPSVLGRNPGVIGPLGKATKGKWSS